ncbi:GL21287 [Drosophila persimilis]|uniref:GL21287 n=1 Tax=Drosophila persimilis TaxID=7234 RepID=B4HAS9_DROPE|nr:GL21287 [Drosophila persimilis]
MHIYKIYEYEYEYKYACVPPNWGKNCRPPPLQPVPGTQSVALNRKSSAFHKRTDGPMGGGSQTDRNCKL